MHRYRHRQLKRRGEPEVNPISREVLFGELVLPVIRELNEKKRGSSKSVQVSND